MFAKQTITTPKHEQSISDVQEGALNGILWTGKIGMKKVFPSWKYMRKGMLKIQMLKKQ